jgi:hypothetical protein
MKKQFSPLALKFMLFLAENKNQNRHSGAGRNPVFTREVALPGCRIKPGMTEWLESLRNLIPFFWFWLGQVRNWEKNNYPILSAPGESIVGRPAGRPYGYLEFWVFYFFLVPSVPTLVFPGTMYAYRDKLAEKPIQVLSIE